MNLKKTIVLCGCFAWVGLAHAIIPQPVTPHQMPYSPPANSTTHMQPLPSHAIPMTPSVPSVHHYQPPSHMNVPGGVVQHSVTPLHPVHQPTSLHLPQQAHHNMPMAGAPQNMYVMLAAHANVQPNHSGVWTLTLDRVDVKHIMQFSEQPLRVVRYVSPQDVQHMWSSGKMQSFAVNPPSAVVIVGHSMQVVHLLGMSINGDQVVYQIKGAHGPLQRMAGGQVVMFMEAKPAQ
jgi:hypothetical protein